MQTSRITWLSVLLVLLALTAAGFLATGEIETIRGAGIQRALPARVGPYVGHDVLFCQNEQCLRSFDARELENRTACPACGGRLDPVSLAERQALPPDTVIIKKQYGGIGLPAMMVSVVISSTEQKSIHRPQQCLPAQGFVIESQDVTDVPLPSNGALAVMLLHLRQRLTDFSGKVRSRDYDFGYWFTARHVNTPYHLERLARTAFDRVVYGRNYQWAYVSILCDDPGLSPARRRERLVDFIAALYPQLATSAPAAAQPVAQ